jgi:hypothetical protein
MTGPTREQLLDNLTALREGKADDAQYKTLVKHLRGNSYDKRDLVDREGAIIAGPLKMACYRVRDPYSGEFGGRQFHATFDNTILALMGEEAAKLFARFVCGHLDIQFGEAVPPKEVHLTMAAKED